MVNDHRTANLLREFLSTMYLSPPNAPGRHMLENRLRNYLAWKTGFASEGNPTSANNRQKTDRVETPRVEPFEDSGVSEALKRKDVGRADRFNKRRRVRGGAAGVVTAESSSRKGKGREVEVIQIEGDAIQSEANVFKKQ
jgi:DNA excision repair protein ERCC-4